MRTRALTRVPTSVDVEGRKFSAIITTETPVRTWVTGPDGRCLEVDEILVTAGVDLSRARGMPLVDAHNTYSLDSVLGVIDEVRAEDVEGLGSCLVVDARVVPSRAELMPAIAEGFYPQLSAGFIVHEYELEDRLDQVPVARAVRWTLLESSLVPVGADPNATVRGASQHPLPVVRKRAADTTQEKTPVEEFLALVAAAETALADAATAVAAIPTEYPEGADDAVKARVDVLRAAVATEADPSAEGGAARAEGDPAAAEEKKEEDQVRALAVKAGLRSLADSHFKAGFKASEVRSAISAALVQRSAGSGVTAPAGSQRAPQQSAAKTINARDLFASMNKRAR